MASEARKTMTYGDGLALKVMAGEKLGLNPGCVDIAKKHLSGDTVHPMNMAAVEKEAAKIHKRLAKDTEAMVAANKVVNEIAVEYGFKAA